MGTLFITVRNQKGAITIMKGLTKLGLILSLVGLLLAGCTATPEKADEAAAAAEEGAMAGAEGEGAAMEEGMEGGMGAETMGMEEAGGFEGDPLDDPDSMLARRVVYFDFDSSVVKDEFSAIIEAHASYLANNPGARLTLEGHADERGTREYNLALGERRAAAVQQFMELMGAGSTQIQTVSYGEERPVDPGHDEQAWALNRRVELVYTSR
jgi:peptidoglycan-associated lipoprotein